MALTINPTVCGTRRGFIVETALFAVGAYLGAMVAFLLVATSVGLAQLVLPESWVLALILAVIVCGILHDLGLPVWLPYRKGQVPEGFRRYLPREAVALAFGIQLGGAFFTFFTYSTQLAFLAVLPFVTSNVLVLIALGVYVVGKCLVLASGLNLEELPEVSARFAISPTRMRVLRLTTALMSTALAIGLVISSAD